MDTNAYTIAGPVIGMTRKELDRFSLSDLVRAAAHEDVGQLSFHSGISDAVAAATGQQASATRSFFIPADVMRRDMTAGSGPTGGYLVDSPVVDFAGALHAASLTARLPMRRIPAKGNASVGAMTGTPTTTWLSGENDEAADAAPTFGTKSAVPKTISTVAWLSRQLVLQAPMSAGFVEMQRAAALAKAIDTGFVQGAGSAGEPTGLLTLAGTSATSGSSLAYSGVVAMQKATEGYSANPPHVLLGVDAAALLRQRAKISGSQPILDNGRVDNLPTFVSRAMPADAMLMFDPTLRAEIRWCALEVTITPLGSPDAFKHGAVGVRLIQSIDWITDHPSVISKSTSIT
jgi:hypothetical protein